MTVIDNSRVSKFPPSLHRFFIVLLMVLASIAPLVIVLALAYFADSFISR